MLIYGGGGTGVFKFEALSGEDLRNLLKLKCPPRKSLSQKANSGQIVNAPIKVPIPPGIK